MSQTSMKRIKPIETFSFHMCVAAYARDKDQEHIHKFYNTLTKEQKDAIGEVPYMFPFQMDYTYETFQKEFTARTGLVFSRWFKGEDTDIRVMSSEPEIYVLQYMCLLYHH